MCRSVAGLVLLSPGRHGPEYWTETEAVARQGILDAGWDFGVNLAMNDFVALQFAEMLGEHLLICARDETLQLAEAARATLEIEQY